MLSRDFTKMFNLFLICALAAVAEAEYRTVDLGSSQWTLSNEPNGINVRLLCLPLPM